MPRSLASAMDLALDTKPGEDDIPAPGEDFLTTDDTSPENLCTDDDAVKILVDV